MRRPTTECIPSNLIVDVTSPPVVRPTRTTVAAPYDAFGVYVYATSDFPNKLSTAVSLSAGEFPRETRCR